MKRFTVGERRGSIMVLCAMIILASFLIFNKGQQHSASVTIQDTSKTHASTSPTADSSRVKKSNKRNKRKKTKQSKIRKEVPQGKSREYLDEGV